MELKIIARIHSDFPTKFGIPRQSGLVKGLRATVVFEPEYRIAEAVRGLEDFSHIWLVWQFSQAVRQDWSPTVRPPRLGGNKRMGVFATRSPFRPNAIGLSSVELESIEYTKDLGPVLHVSGADLMDGTPIYDIKPYLPYADSHPEARGGFAQAVERRELAVDFPTELLEQVAEDRREGLVELLKQDPRPAYQKDPQRVYGFPFGGLEIKFTVDDESMRVTVRSIERIETIIQ
ncbi:MAG: tRNA (N6-threonylcarbamoyladenosine(37)-N6)-methyltransferase TrmO [Firmicutes bacterium]|nr:tRNA (N6-threonylcarbamoyladenosine(37)-N6)-methyltransferase TrmO [Bacillota bacterium]